MPDTIKYKYPEIRICLSTRERCLCCTCLRHITPLQINECPKDPSEKCKAPDCALHECADYVKASENRDELAEQLLDRSLTEEDDWVYRFVIQRYLEGSDEN